MHLEEWAVQLQGTQRNGGRRRWWWRWCWGDGGCGVSFAACAHCRKDFAGVGGKKVQRIYDAFHEPFLSSKKPRTEP